VNLLRKFCFERTFIGSKPEPAGTELKTIMSPEQDADPTIIANPTLPSALNLIFPD
jgi:hypothetical protein